jgi:hypothetical protein
VRALLSLFLLALLAALPAAAAVPGCGFNECTAANGCRVLLCTTLDNGAETLAPDVGPNAVSLTNVDFVGGVVDQGMRANSVGEYAAYPQIGTDARGATLQSIENTRGTLDFWYKPNYDQNDPGEYFIFTNVAREATPQGVITKPSGLELLKHSALGNGNSLAVNYWDGVATETLQNGLVIPKRWEFWVYPQDYTWEAGVWTNLRLTWDWTSSGVPLRMWQDSKELPLQRADGGPAWKGPMGVAPESPNQSLFVCGRPAGTGGALFQYNGVCDQLRIYDRPVTPSVSVPPPGFAR